MTPARDPDGPGALARALDDPDLPPPGAIGAGQARRFDIHRNNVARGVVETLRASFPVVERLVGEAFFAALARAYHAAEPPASPLLFRYGAGFAAFIDGFPPARPVPYLGDVARLEWLRLQAYHAADAAPAGLDALSGLAPEAMAGARLTLHPSFGLVRSRWPVVSIWAASGGQGDPATVDMRTGEDVAVIRPGLGVETRALPPGGGAFLASLAGGAALGPAARAGADETTGFDLATHLRGIFAMGAVTGVTTPGAPDTEGTVA